MWCDARQKIKGVGDGWLMLLGNRVVFKEKALLPSTKPIGRSIDRTDVRKLLMKATCWRVDCWPFKTSILFYQIIHSFIHSFISLFSFRLKSKSKKQLPIGQLLCFALLWSQLVELAFCNITRLVIVNWSKNGRPIEGSRATQTTNMLIREIRLRKKETNARMNEWNEAFQASSK